MILMLLDVTMSRYLRAVSLMAATLPSITAQPTAQLSTSSKPNVAYDRQDVKQVLFKRSDAQQMTAVVVGTTVAVGAFILVLLFLAVWLWRQKLLRIDGRGRPASSPREHIYREQHKRRSSGSKSAHRRGERHSRRSSHEKRNPRTSLEQPSSTAVSIASSFSPADPSNLVIPEMAQIPPSRSEPSRFCPPVSLPPLITQPQQLHSIDATVNMALDPASNNRSSRWSMSTLGMNLLRDTMQQADPERYTESSPSSRYQETTPSGYAYSPAYYEASPVKRVSFALAELPGCDGQSSSPWRYDSSPETPQGWNRGPSEDDLVTPVIPRHLTTSEVDQRPVASSLNTIYEERESLRHYGT